MKAKSAVWAVVCFLMIGLNVPAMAADSIKIGFHAPLTGFAASDGKSATEGARLAVSQVNAAGGVLATNWSWWFTTTRPSRPDPFRSPTS
jgi:branched-chain amino acid transport system substrate-binding protein